MKNPIHVDIMKHMFSILSFLFFLSSAFAEKPSLDISYTEEAAEEQYLSIVEAAEGDDWSYVRDNSLRLLRDYGASGNFQELYYYLALSYYNYADFEFCNDYLTKYLETTTAASHFEAALQYKFWVAEQFRSGSKKRIFKWQSSPIYLSAHEDALDIYEEIIATLPFSELAVQSLYGKANVHSYFEEPKESIKAYQTITQKFAKHELAIESYIAMGDLYLYQCQTEHLDPDLLDSAESNYRKFSAAFPGEERLSEAKETLQEMREAFANNLYETGRFYERTYKPRAALIYYKKVLHQFPKTVSAKECQKRIDVLS